MVAQVSVAHDAERSHSAWAAHHEPANVHKLLCGFANDLADAHTMDAIVVALSSFGANFGMPHVDVFTSNPQADDDTVVTVCQSLQFPKPVLDALRNHPVHGWAITSPTPVSLSDLDEKLKLRRAKREPALEGIEGLLVNLRVEPGRVHHYGFFGGDGLVNGLSRSLFCAVAELAHERPNHNSRSSSSFASKTTPREANVLRLSMRGLSDREIAHSLGIATRTVRFHLKKLRTKFDAPSRGALIALAAKRLRLPSDDS